MKYKVSSEKPPVYDRAEKIFGISWDRRIIFAYGDTIHTKDPSLLTPDVIAHECVHLERQQILGVEKWWENYFHSPQFRFDEEILAYQAQWKYVEKFCPRHERLGLLKFFARSLISIYGFSNLDYWEAMEKIKGAK